MSIDELINILDFNITMKDNFTIYVSKDVTLSIHKNIKNVCCIRYKDEKPRFDTLNNTIDLYFKSDIREKKLKKLGL